MEQGRASEAGSRQRRAEEREQSTARKGGSRISCALLSPSSSLTPAGLKRVSCKICCKRLPSPR